MIRIIIGVLLSWQDSRRKSYNAICSLFSFNTNGTAVAHTYKKQFITPSLSFCPTTPMGLIYNSDGWVFALAMVSISWVGKHGLMAALSTEQSDALLWIASGRLPMQSYMTVLGSNSPTWQVSERCHQQNVLKCFFRSILWKTFAKCICHT